MFSYRNLLKQINVKFDEILNRFAQSNIEDLAYILGSKKEMIKRNFLAGIFRGVGIGIGVTLITAILILVLRKLVKLNIPVIGNYLTDIIDIVQNNKLK